MAMLSRYWSVAEECGLAAVDVAEAAVPTDEPNSCLSRPVRD
jgi:hypothetical protein